LSPTDVVVATSSKPDDPNAIGLGRNLTQLQSWAEQTSPIVSVHSLPTPPPRSIAGQRMPESYCNFLMLGPSAIIAPTFGHRKSDNHALGMLRELCPAAKVVGVDASEFIWGRGAWHCASQQQPAPPQ
ncbi:MAG: agmatine deiminase family protein, partial [Planctomycetaceae bacterium]